MLFVRIDWRQTPDERAMKMDRFQSDPALKIMLLSTGCGSTGYRLWISRDEPEY